MVGQSDNKLINFIYILSHRNFNISVFSVIFSGFSDLFYIFNCHFAFCIFNFALSNDLILPLPNILSPLFRHFNKNFKRGFNNKIKYKDKDINTGKFFA